MLDRSIFNLVRQRAWVMCVCFAVTYGAWVRSEDRPEGEGGNGNPALLALPLASPFASAESELSTHRLIADWYRSAHADTGSAASLSWVNARTIPADCARCHSGEGFRDYLGLDGSPPGVTNGSVNTGAAIDCDSCHHVRLPTITEISLPSGVAFPLHETGTSCLACHQGKAAGATVARDIDGLPLDEVEPSLSLVLPHFGHAATTWLGAEAASGYQYADREYSSRFRHARPVEVCTDCHNPHSLKVDLMQCKTCHKTTIPGDIRSPRRRQRGEDGMPAGVRSIIETRAAILFELIKDYGVGVAGVSMVYDANRDTLFFADADGDGAADLVEGKPVAYASWTPRSLRAAFNWQWVVSDSGSYVHNPKYALELLHDSIADLCGPLGLDINELGQGLR